jgi:two-component system sensor histidine kinase KdpD
MLMAVVAFVISAQTERIRRREERTRTLYAMTRELTAAGSVDEVAAVARRHLREVFEVDATISIQGDADVLRAVGPNVARANRDLLRLFESQISMALERARLVDATQRAQLEIKTERLRNALLSSVSHDLRTPLGVIKGAVTALIDGGAKVPPERVREHLMTISAEATHLNRLFRNLLDVTALEAGTVRVRKEWQLLEEVIGVAQSRLEDQLEGRRVQVRIDAEAALAPFDETLLEQVFVNLIENATKYTGPSSPIEIEATMGPGAVEVTVSDRGPGIPEGRTEAIFEKFHRATDSASGIGLGLTICRGIVTAHGGEISGSNRDGGGAVFKFTLPLDSARPLLEELPEAADES